METPNQISHRPIAPDLDDNPRIPAHLSREDVCHMLRDERRRFAEERTANRMLRAKQDAMQVLAGHARKAWSPINTAPQDGTVFQAFAPHDSGGYQFSASVNKDGRILSMMCGTDVTDRVTLWQPLPEFPED